MRHLCSCSAARCDGGQTDFYDQPAQVALAVEAADAFLKGTA